MLNQYNKRFIRKQQRRQVENKVETREAVIFDILDDQHQCRVKVTGVDTPIVAYYPENWEAAPQYLKVGNPVTVRHVGGNRHRIEIVEHGTILPIKIEHGTPAVGANCVLDGCLIRAIPNNRMAIYVTTGTYRITGSEYELDTLKMGSGSGMIMGDSIPMGECAAIKTIDAASSTLYRFDLIVVGTDGVVDVVKGTASATDPDFPDLPAGHVQLGWVFLPPNTTEISDALINSYYDDPTVSTMSVSVDNDSLRYYTNPDPPPPLIPEMSTDMTVSVLDQYGNAITGTNWGITAEFISGNGYINDSETSFTKHTGNGDNEATFTYTRIGDDTDESPMIKFTLVQEELIFQATFIALYDDTDALML